MSVPIKPSADGSIDLGSPIPLFAADIGGAVTPVVGADYASTPDGQRFLLNRLLRNTGAAPVRVVLNWRGAT